MPLFRIGESQYRPCADNATKDNDEIIVDLRERSERSVSTRIARARYTSWLSRQRARPGKPIRAGNKDRSRSTQWHKDWLNPLSKSDCQAVHVSDDQLGVYENRAVIRFNIIIPPNQHAGKNEIKAHLSYQSCSDEVCFPPAKSEISVTLNVL